MLAPDPATYPGSARGLDHVGVFAADLDSLARAFVDAGFSLTSCAMHISGRAPPTAVGCFRDGGYLELIAKVPGQTSATVDRFLARGAGRQPSRWESPMPMAAWPRAIATGGHRGQRRFRSLNARRVRTAAWPVFAVVVPPDPPEGRVLLIRHLTRDRLWRPENVVHPNGALALTEAVYAVDLPAETMSRLSRLTGRPAEPDPLGGYRIPLARGRLRILPRGAAPGLFPTATASLPLIGLRVAAGISDDRMIKAGGIAIRLAASPA